MVNAFVHQLTRPGPALSACALMLTVFALLVLPGADNAPEAPAGGAHVHDIHLTHHHKETVTP